MGVLYENKECRIKKVTCCCRTIITNYYYSIFSHLEIKNGHYILFINFSWPHGKYCVYKKGSSCPSGLREGFVYWDDENIDNKNDFNGDMPEGVYTDKTDISFCCSTTGKAESEIVLPTEKPFYLFPYESTACQKVSMFFSGLPTHVYRCMYHRIPHKFACSISLSKYM